MEKRYTHLIWDFNGTIFDDVDAGIVSTNKMLRDRGLAQINGVSHYREIFDFPIEEYYRKLGFDFEKEPYSVLAPIWVQLYEKNAESATLTHGVLEAMKEISSLGIRQIVLSACEINMLTGYLEGFGVLTYLDEVMGLDNIHAKSKLELARAWRDRNPGIRPLMIGDTTHDFETAELLGADCVLYTGGHQSKERLQRCGCPLIDKMEDVLTLVK